MTPPVNPSIPSSTRRGISLNKKTSAAPEAVTNQVKVVAKKASSTGWYWLSVSKKVVLILGIKGTSRNFALGLPHGGKGTGGI